MDIKHDEIIEHLAAYSLGVLELELSERVEQHLDTCEICQGELAVLQDAVMALALSVPDIRPPAGARERFSQLIDEATKPTEPVYEVQPSRTAERNGANREHVPAVVAVPGRAIIPSRPVAERRPWWQLFSPAAWATAAALAVLLFLAGAWGIGQRNELEQQRTAYAQTQQQITQLQQQIEQQQAAAQQQQATLQQQIDQQQSALQQLQQEHDFAVAMLSDPNVQAYTLQSSGAANGSVARLWVDQSSQQAVLVANNLAPVSDGQVYELWLIADQPVAIDVFNASANGTAVLIFELTQPISQFKQIAITVEPGKVQAPTGEPILAGAIQV